MEAGQRTFDELTKGHTPDGLSPVTIEIEGVRIRVRRAAACIGACRREPAAVVSVEGHTHRPLSVSAVTAQDVISTVMQFIGALSVRLPQKTEESA